MYASLSLSYLFPESLSQIQSTFLRLNISTVEWLLRWELERDGIRNYNYCVLHSATFLPVATAAATADATIAIAVEIRNNRCAVKEESSEGNVCVADFAHVFHDNFS